MSLRTDEALPMRLIAVIISVVIIVIWLAPAIPVTLLGAVAIALFGFFFATVSPLKPHRDTCTGKHQCPWKVPVHDPFYHHLHRSILTQCLTFQKNFPLAVLVPSSFSCF